MNDMISTIFMRFQKMNTMVFVLIGTAMVLVFSVPLTYALTSLFGETYSVLILLLSILLPLMLTPIALFFVIHILHHLHYFKDALSESIDENRKKDLLLYEQARFAFMGEMLSNISHQWRQPLHTINLAILSSKTEFIKESFDLEKITSNLDVIEANTHYLSKTIDDFKTFFQKRGTAQVCPLIEILDEVQSVATPIFEYNTIDFMMECTDAKEVMLYAPLSQVLLNLIGNSVDALKASKNFPKQIHVTCKTVGKELHIHCCDNGVGIESVHQSRIFDPYFSTKSRAQGTGIGLYMSRQIIEKMFEGTLKLESTESGKTCFHMTIPPISKDGNLSDS